MKRRVVAHPSKAVRPGRWLSLVLVLLAALAAGCGGNHPGSGTSSSTEAGAPEAGTPEAGTPEAGQDVVVIDADSLVRAAVKELHVVVSTGPATGALAPTDDQHIQAPSWPVQVTLSPQGGDRTRRFQLTADALDANGDVVSQGSVSGSYADAPLALWLSYASLPEAGAPDSGNTDPVVGFSAGGQHTCALTGSGRVFCWGNNGYGQLGDGTSTQRTTAVEVQGLPAAATAIALGQDFTCALLDGGLVYCWGEDVDGELGSNGPGTWQANPTPVLIAGVKNAIAIGAGARHACVVTSAHAVECWGAGNEGQLGDGSTDSSLAPVAVSGLTDAVAVGGGDGFTCALESTGSVQCWGAGTAGQLGDGLGKTETSPTVVSNLTNATSLSVGAFNACAVDATKELWCWGGNQFDQAGLLNPPASIAKTPNQISNADADGGLLDVAGVSVGGTALQQHICARTSDGTVLCWGSAAFDQLGTPDGNASFSVAWPVPVDPSAQAIVSGGEHSCARLADGSVWCWGANGQGQLGNGSTDTGAVPAPVVGLP